MIQLKRTMDLGAIGRAERVGNMACLADLAAELGTAPGH